MFRAATLLAFFGAFRISELVATSKSDTSRVALQITDVLLRPEHLHITVRRSKAYQRGLGAVVQLDRCSQEALCPVEVMQEYMRQRGEAKGYLFAKEMAPH